MTSCREERNKRRDRWEGAAARRGLGWHKAAAVAAAERGALWAHLEEDEEGGGVEREEQEDDEEDEDQYDEKSDSDNNSMDSYENYSDYDRKW